jgi:hypothetical protein
MSRAVSIAALTADSSFLCDLQRASNTMLEGSEVLAYYKQPVVRGAAFELRETVLTTKPCSITANFELVTSHLCRCVWLHKNFEAVSEIIRPP